MIVFFFWKLGIHSNSNHAGESFGIFATEYYDSRELRQDLNTYTVKANKAEKPQSLNFFIF